MHILNSTQNTVLAQHAVIADNMKSRMVGLLKHRELLKGHALVITQCWSIHMFFMKFAIDAVFVSKDNIVVGLVENIKPFQLSRIFFKASFAIECPVGTIKNSQTQMGDTIELN